MELNPDRLDGFVRDAVRKNPGLNREGIMRLVADHVSRQVFLSIERLVANKEIIEERDTSKGSPYIYSVPPQSPMKRRF